MKQSFLPVAVAAVVALCVGFYPRSGAQPPAEAAPVRLGVFDSRALAIAFTRSDAFDSELDELQREHEAAKSAGDEERAAALEARAQAHQDLVHRQAFSTAPVDDVLARIEDRLPSVATAAGVDVIVSKWRIAYRAEGAELVDVTAALAALFEPDEATLAVLAQIAEQDPLPLYETDWEAVRDH